MSRTVRVFVISLLAGAPAWAADVRALRVQATSAAEVSAWDARVTAMIGAGDLRVRWSREDPLLPGRLHERLAQLYEGVPVFGGELVRQSDGFRTLTLFGTLYEGIDLAIASRLGGRDAEALVESRGGTPFGSQGEPRLTILPREGAGYVLTWKMRAVFREPSYDIRILFVDAASGEVVHEYSDLQTQAVGEGTGVLGDRKKVSTVHSTTTYTATDRLRPPLIETYDFKGDIYKILFLRSVSDLEPTDVASDADNTWTDGAVVDAHVYAGYVYDYYYKRFNRRGLDDANIPIRSITHPVRREDIFSSPNDDYIGVLYLNAAYIGNGLIYYGEGLPAGLTAGGQHWNYTSGGFDIVAHELSHGVTDYSSQLIYRNESGALNEAFSDIMGVSAEFFFQAARGATPPDYQMGEDVVTPGGIRSLQNPRSFGDPDHYSLRYQGPEDNGGVHTNSTIASHAFYLAIEGGQNRVSGVSVDGVGASNREQVEKAFYRAFTLLLPASATFATARAATVRSAAELFGSGSPAERAIAQAWTAVGVE
jgi:thermolysin